MENQIKNKLFDMSFDIVRNDNLNLIAQKQTVIVVVNKKTKKLFINSVEWKLPKNLKELSLFDLIIFE
jgi:acyl-CoA thioesterase FadM